MQQADVLVSLHDGGERELCFLSLDGGGVRGLSSLCILDELMRKVNPDNPPSPCDYFDLIGGTSTGGLIAIMLGRLHMTIDECRAAYRDLSDEAFQITNHRAAPSFSMPWNWKLPARFDTEALERGFKRIIVNALKKRSENACKAEEELTDTLLKEASPKCRVFVISTNARFPDRTIIFANYVSDRWPRDLLNSVKIWEAARATSAAPTFFESIRLGPDNEEFLDGATGANNPVNSLWNEGLDIWKPGTPLEERLHCLVSIGTGVPSVNAFGSGLKDIGITLKAMSTETETTANEFMRRYSRLHKDQKYFRFNVRSGLEGIGLEEASKRADIISATRRYLTTEEDRVRLETCADMLRIREWETVISYIMDQAAQEFSRANERLRHLAGSYQPELGDAAEWLKNIPEYRQWIKGRRGLLYCIDEDGGSLRSFLTTVAGEEFGPGHLHSGNIIYIDLSQYTRRPLQMRVIRSVLLQALHRIARGSRSFLKYMGKSVLKKP
ncbi:uncharacterized protein DSM5745_09655 [Aspergillus mulundensis]|uniref:PNPLA domain-containing protein n=1 Tax=Aspergillus mulundensis TaxID=1810919 RepID=A0A3D8QVS0_9EURO|nr:hypothetical protein DSM5745_09655 [Aspergillus mulundensis]RDW65916.1 hypothetical protein DSM5745_09655 [Aspergillus mulundensis]